ncbi:MAG: hypothetical protein ABIO55_09300 [Ginsengibacter sp.]
MKKILIISSHFPPSNLAGVHRSRFFAKHLPDYNWEPIVLTVHEKYYEEQLDWNLVKLLPKDLKIEKANAFKLNKPRLIGDIGLRAFFQLYKKAKQIIKKETIDFLYIPIPSFYVALLGRWLYASTGIRYGIDYIDPWVHYFPGSEKFLSRHWLSTKLAKFLEPIAVKKASLITGVAEGYYKGVIERNPGLLNNCVFGAMPYGGEAEDHKRLREMNIKPYLFSETSEKVRLVYAGAMLPRAYELLELIFQSIDQNEAHFKGTEFHFIGTGKTPDDKSGFNIRPLAKKYNLWQTIVYEYPERIPYLDVLAHLNAASGIFILGSTEPHYTPSKVYQGILTGKPILAVLNKLSTAVKVLEGSNGGILVTFNGADDLGNLKINFLNSFLKFKSFLRSFDISQVNRSIFNDYSANAVTKQLTELLNKIVP